MGEGEGEVVSAGPGTVGRGLRGVRVGSAAGSRVVVEKVVGGAGGCQPWAEGCEEQKYSQHFFKLRCARERKCFAEPSLVLRAGFYGSGL